MPQNQYRILSFGRQRGIGVTGSMQITVSAVAKTNSGNAPYCVANELVCLEIGRFLRLPVPPGGIFTDGSKSPKNWFATMDFNLTGNALPPVDPGKCFQQMPELSTGLLLFDILVANSDRHAGNLSVDYQANPAQMSVFGHSHALFGIATGKAKDRFRELQNRLGITGGPVTHGNRHCLLDFIDRDNHLGKWAERIGALPDFLIDETCADAIGLGADLDETKAAADFIKHRRDDMLPIIKQHKLEFRAIKQWSLFS